MRFRRTSDVINLIAAILLTAFQMALSHRADEIMLRLDQIEERQQTILRDIQ